VPRWAISSGSDEALDCEGVGNPLGGARGARDRGSRCAGDAGVRGRNTRKRNRPRRRPRAADQRDAGSMSANIV